MGACGTKFGKTYGCSIRLVKEAWDNRNSLNWWVAPTFAQSKMAYNQVKRMLPVGMYKEYKADMRLELLAPDGEVWSTIEFKSGDNPDSLRGFAVNFCVIDEAARIQYESFISVMTTLTQTRGRAIIISTPKGRGWFYDVYQRGVKLKANGDPKYPAGIKDPWKEWYSVRLPTWVNPHVPLESIEELRRNLPSQVFRQEVAAQFLMESAGVFLGISDCVTAGPTRELPLPGRRYVLGVDLARLNDYTVLIVMDVERRHVVYFEQFNQISWNLQYYRIMETARIYNNAKIWMDSTGIGDPILNALEVAGLRPVPYKISSNAAKQQLIEKLRINIEHGRISYPNLLIMVDELETYEYNISDGGLVKYSAPEGKHDDCVIALALANMGADQAPWIYTGRNVRGI